MSLSKKPKTPTLMKILDKKNYVLDFWNTPSVITVAILTIVILTVVIVPVVIAPVVIVTVVT